MQREIKILCFGDSNTWGFSPSDGSRFPEEIRWPGVFRRCLGEGYTVIEDGLNGRTLCAFGMEGDPLNGAEHLKSVAKAYAPLDLVILYLGINDLFFDPRISVDSMAVELADSLDDLCTLDTAMKLLLLSPLQVNVGREYHDYYHDQIEKSFSLGVLLKNLAEEKGAFFLDPSQAISASKGDGVHIEAEEHIKLGLHLCVRVREIFSSNGRPIHGQ